MNIVWLTPELPYPANTGGRIVVYNRIKQLNDQGNRIQLITIVDKTDEVDRQKLEEISSDVTIINRNRSMTANLIKTLKSPYCVASRTFREITNKVKKAIVNNQCDVIFCEFTQMTFNILNIKEISKYKCKCILSLHNIESDSMASLASSMKKGIRKKIYELESKRLRILENKIALSGIFDAVCFVSDKDIDIFKRRYPTFAGKLWLSPIGADKQEIRKRISGANIICVGKMSYQPNIAGVTWFANEVMPQILKEINDAMFYIVGKDPTKEVENLANSHIVVTGTVDSVKEYYENASVAVLPIFDGGGVKTKLIEAVSYGVPVISTSFGVLGTAFGKNGDVIIADSAETFTRGIVQCLKNPEYCDKMVDLAHEKFIKNYIWSSICDDLLKKMKSL